jgi:hypothetical protein
MRYVSVDEVRTQLAERPELQEEFRQDPTKALARFGRPLDTDPTIYRIVVLALGIAILVSLAGAIWLTFAGKDVPDVVVALGSAAVGALSGLLAPSPEKG